jgi:hypothetical protein
MSITIGTVRAETSKIRMVLNQLSNAVEEIYTKLEKFDTVTTVHYWDCECDKNYIHPKSLQECDVCKAKQEDSPDSRVFEVIEAKLEI